MACQTLNFQSAKALSSLYCNKPENLALVESTLNVSVTSREDWLKIEGDSPNVAQTADLFHILEKIRAQGLAIAQSDFEHLLSTLQKDGSDALLQTFDNPLVLQFKSRSIIPKTINQKHYLNLIQNHDIVFGIGPAGTGKTFLAVAAALHAFLNDQVEKIILTRPAVEAGEALGFLPGDLQEKILPYLRPLYDAMHFLIGPEETQKLIDHQLIEIAPLAYMRGRTLANAYIILDEAQNTTPEQMLMFLTRLGDNSRMIITGDITQVDLPKAKSSGLKQAIQALQPVKDIKQFFFQSKDVVRHPLVQKIIDAYESFFNN